VVYGKGIDLPGPAAAFASVVIGLYTETLGSWARPVIGASAFLVMFSTTLTVVDGLPRSITAFIARCKSDEVPGDAVGSSHSMGYWITALVVAIGSMLVLSQFLSRLKALVDLATTVALVTAPPLAWLNHRAIYSREVEHPPSEAMRIASWVCMVIMSFLSLYYLYLRFLS
jgi:Mn2+/Fe2+ NRAMP family transporter